MIKKTSLYKLSYLLLENIAKKKVKLHFTNYATKSDLKSAAGINTSKFAKNGNLFSLKPDADKLDIEQIETTPIDLGKQSNVVKNDVVKRIVYHELIKNVNAIQTVDTSDLIKKPE